MRIKFLAVVSSAAERLHFHMTEDLRDALTEIYTDLLEEDYAEVGEFSHKQNATLTLGGAFGEHDQQFEGEGALAADCAETGMDRNRRNLQNSPVSSPGIPSTPSFVARPPARPGPPEVAMRNWTIAVVAAGGLSLLAAGCAPLTGGRTAQGARALKPPSSGHGDSTEEPDEEWIAQAGAEARTLRSREKEPDGWWSRYIMSEKARSIERNFGIDYD